MSEHREDLPKIVQSRLRQQASAPAGVHPNADILTAFVEGGLIEKERQNVLDHLSSCAECREVVSLSLPEQDAASVGASRSARIWNWNLGMMRWAAVAASVVVIASAVLLLNPNNTIPKTMISNETLAQRAAKPDAPKVEAREPQPAAPAPAAIVAEQSKAQRIREKQANDEQDKTKALAEVTSKKREESAFVRTPVVPPAPPPPQEKALNDSLYRANAETKPLAANSNNNLANIRAHGPSNSAANANAPKDVGTGSASGAAGGVVVGGVLPNANGTRATETQNSRTDNFSDLDARSRNEQQTRTAPEQAPTGVQMARKAAVPTPAKPAVANETAKSSADQVASAAETVEVTAAAPIVNTLASQSQSKQLQANFVNDSAGAHISNGKLIIRRELNSPWQEVPFADNPTLRTLAIQANNIWVGGAKGVLYHSADAGTTWSSIKGGWSADSDIIALTFTDLQHGELKTANRERWATEDAGKTWKKK